MLVKTYVFYKNLFSYFFFYFYSVKVTFTTFTNKYLIFWVAAYEYMCMNVSEPHLWHMCVVKTMTNVHTYIENVCAHVHIYDL